MLKYIIIMTSRSKPKVYASAAIVVVFAVLSCLWFTACANRRADITVLRDGITLIVGEYRDIRPYVAFVPIDAERGELSLSSDGDALSVSGTTVYAVKPGEATVTIYCGKSSATIKASVINEPLIGLEMTAVGELVQTADKAENATPIEFSAAVRGARTDDTAISWTINGEGVASGDTFTFTPKSYGEFIVRAELGEYGDEKTVRVYRPSTTSVKVSGKTVQTDGDFSAVVYTAAEKPDHRNPLSVMEWFVNGKKAGSGAAFSFTPGKAGDYEVMLKVNGKERGFEGNKIKASGERAPRGRVSFDDEIGVKVRWDDGEYIERATVYDPSGKRTDILRTDAQDNYRFGKGYLDVTDIVEVFSDTPGKYEIELVAEGKSAFEFAQYSTAVKKYAENKVFCRNNFVTDESECEYWIHELYLTGAKSGECYVPLGGEKLKQTAVNAAKAFCDDVTVEAVGNILKIRLGDYVNIPTKYEKSSDGFRVYVTPPHIEYDENARRPEGYVFMSDRAPRSVEVSSSEQLLYAVSEGYRPLPKKESTAEHIYGAARNILMSIIGRNYSDADKVHAIYDWVQWRSRQSRSTDGKKCSGYLEGLFGSADPDWSSATVSPMLNADGMSKSVSFLCNIEGIECVRLCADVGNEIKYWNKVKLDGAWYNVDVFDGEETDRTPGAVLRERQLHGGLLVSDERQARLIGVAGIEDIERTAYNDMLSVYMNKVTAGGAYFDHYIDKPLDEKTIKQAVYAAFASAKLGSFSVPTVGSTVVNTNSTLGAEFMLSSTDEEFVLGAYKALESAVRSYCKEVLKIAEPSFTIGLFGDVIYAAATAPPTV